MDRLIKKYFWVTNLLTIAAVCYLLASIVNDQLFQTLFKYPQVTLPRAQRKKPAALINTPKDFAVHLSQWSIFNRVKEDLPDDKKDKKDDKKDKKDDDTIQLSQLDVKLIGTMVIGTSPEMSHALVNIDSETTSVSIGSKLGKTNAVVVGIQRKYIEIDEGDKKIKYIKLWTPQETKPISKLPTYRRGYRRPNRFRRPTYVRPRRVNYRKSVKLVRPYEYKIDRNFVRQNLADMSDLIRGVRIIPQYRGSRFNGMKLGYISSASALRAIGLQSGDTLRNVNGRPISSPNEAMMLFQKMKNSAEIKLGVERHGLIKTFTYKMK